MKINKSDKFYALKKTLERRDLRDTFRALFVLIKNDLELDIDPKKIYSILDGYELPLRTIKTFNCNNKSKPLLKEIDGLKEEIELLSKDNKNLKIKLEEKRKTNEALLESDIKNLMTMVDQNLEHQKRIKNFKKMNFFLLLSTILFGGVAFYLYFKGVCL